MDFYFHLKLKVKVICILKVSSRQVTSVMTLIFSSRCEERRQTKRTTIKGRKRAPIENGPQQTVIMVYWTISAIYNLLMRGILLPIIERHHFNTAITIKLP